MKITRLTKHIFFSFLISSAFIFLSCEDVSSDGDLSSGSNVSSDNEKTPASSSLSYDYITKNRSFIGGSLIYNPTGFNNQLESGTKIGVRLGTLQGIEQPVTKISGIDYSSPHQEVEINLNEDDSLSSISIDGASLKSDYQMIYEDLPEKAVYGYISVNSVSQEQISFTFTSYSLDGSRFSESSYVISKGETCDINGDYIADISYDTPPIMRSGYSDALWLTFLCNESTCKTTMFYTFTEKEKEAGYRAATNSDSSEDNSSLPKEGFYGINSDGRFIFIKHQGNSTATEQDFKAVFGDFVVGISTENKDISEIEASAVSEGTEIEGQSFSISSECYTVVSGTSDPKFFSVIDFENYVYKYTYTKYQFPDSEKGPKALLDELCKNDMIRDEITKLYASYKTGALPEEAREVISLLNKILNTKSTVYTIACENGYKDLYEALEADTDIIPATTLARRIIDKCYTQSPKADIKAAEISNIYPNLFVNIGSSREIEYDSADNLSRSICSTYNEYDTKNKKISKKWSEFSSISLSTILLKDNEGKTHKIMLQKDMGLTLSAGMKGSLSVNSSCARANVGAAIYINLNADVTQLVATNLLNILVDGMQLGLKDVPIHIGPVPCVFGVIVIIGTKLSTDLSPRICFTGLYGGEANFGAKYGIDWWWGIPYPYFSTFASGNAICETEAYIGVKGTDKTLEWGPYVKVIPSFGIGWSKVSIRGSVPITASLNIKNNFTGNEAFTEFAKLNISSNFEPYFEAKILDMIKIKKTFTSIKLLDGTLRMYPLPIMWM